MKPDDPEVMLIAHRAGNSLARMGAALEAGADVVEVDLRWHRRRVEVRHSKRLSPFPLYWDRWELGYGRRLGLDELLAAAPAQARFMFDLKAPSPRMGEALAVALADLRKATAYFVCSTQWELLAPFASVPEATVVHSAGRPRAFGRLQELLRARGAQAVSVHRRFLTGETARNLRESAGLVITWPVNDLRSLQQLRRWGVNGFTTDSLDVIRAVAASRNSASA